MADLAHRLVDDALSLSVRTSGGAAFRFESDRCVYAALGPELGLEQKALLGSGFVDRLDSASRRRLVSCGSGPLEVELSLGDVHLLLEGHIEVAGATRLFTARVLRPRLEPKVESLAQSLRAANFGVAITRGQAPFEALYVNPAFERQSGRSFDELRGKNLRVLQQGTNLDQSGARTEMRTALEEGRCCQVEFQNSRPDGELYFCQVTILPVWGEGPRPELFLGLQRDVSEERKIELANEHERSLLAEAEAVARCGTWQWDVSSGLVSWSPGIYRICGVSPTEPPPPFEAQVKLYEDGFGTLVEAVQRCVETGESYALDLRLRHQGDGRQMWTQARGRRIVDPETGQMRLVGTLQDIDARKAHERELEAQSAELERARDRAEAADRAKSAFLANMSHEIRTPLNGVIGAASLLLESGMDREGRELTQTIRSSGEVLLGLINDVLDVSKIESGEMALERRRFDLEDTVEEVLQLFAPRARDRDTQLDLIYHPGTPERVDGDSTRIQQIMTNLVGNAVKFTEGGAVTVEVSKDGDGLRLSVRDTGIGIAPEGVSRLFKPFAQADSTTNRRFGGTGLGLTISRNLARLMGGDIEVESEEGVGSCFTFHFPCTWSERRPSGHALEGLQVALTGADAARRAHLTRLLEGEGAQIVDAPGGEVVELNGPSDLQAEGGGERVVQLRPEGRVVEAVEPGAHLVLPVRRSALVEAVARAAGRKGELAEAPEADCQFDVDVLVVDDNRVNRTVAAKMLERLGARCVTAESGFEAIERCTEQSFDLVLMDVQMPEMDGYETTQHIRRRPEGAALHIVALTANALAEHREQALASGMDAYMAKPVRLEDLSALLARSTRRRRTA